MVGPRQTGRCPLVHGLIVADKKPKFVRPSLDITKTSPYSMMYNDLFSLSVWVAVGSMLGAVGS